MKILNFFQHFFILLLFLTLSNKSVAQTNALIEKYLDASKSSLETHPDSCPILANKALELATKSHVQECISKANQILGKYYTSREDFGKATQYFLEALTIEEKRKDIKRIADLHDELGIVYSYLENFNKSLGYYTSALNTYQKLNDTFNIGKVTVHIGILHSSREYCQTRSRLEKTIDYRTAIQYFEKALQLFKQLNNKGGIINCYHNLAAVYNKFEQPGKGLKYMLEVLAYYKETNNWDGITGALSNIGASYVKLKDYKKSIESYEESLRISKERNLTGGIQFLYGDMAYAYKQAQDYKNALEYYTKYMTLRDSIYNADKSKQMFELETKYQTEKKEKEILTLTYQKKRRNLFIILLVSAFIISALAGFYVIQRIHTKKIIAEQANKINEQKIKQLERDQQLIATQLVLQGEEAERSRLAKDLHDGLGGLLSGIKLTLSNMKGNVVLESESVSQFDKALGMLDSSIQELRRVAHNMMPEALVKFGLKEALSDFCHSITNKQIDINFQHFGLENRFDAKIEISMYRIAQELINNAFKHSHATTLLVQLIQEEGRINLSVQDNGKGFDTAILKTSKGAGIANIRSRVESLQGIFDLVSEPDKGTEVTVEFRLNKSVQ